MNLYEASKLADFHGEDDRKLPLILGSYSGDFLRSAKTRTEAYNDTIVLWFTGEAKSAITLGGQGQGKTMLDTGILAQLITARKRFGEEFAQFDLPHIILDAAGEFTHEKFAHQLENPRLVERMKPYYQWMPFLKPIGIEEKCVYYTPVNQMKALAARDVYGDHYIGLKAEDLKRIDFQEAYQLICELLNIKEEDPASRIVRRGCTELLTDNPTFFGILATMLEEEQREILRRRSQSVSRQAQVMLRNAIYDGEVETNSSPNIRDDLEQKKVAVYHFPIKTSGLRTTKVMFALYLARALDEVATGAPPFSLYGEEMHKPLLDEPNSVFSRSFRDIYQLHRKCISGDTLLFCSDGAMVRAEDFVFGNLNSLDKNFEIQPSAANRIIKKEAPILETTTQHGFKIKTSKDHLFLTVDGWKEAQALKQGDHIAIAREWKTDGLNELIRINKKRLKVDIDDDFAYFMGLFIGDGSFHGSEKYGNLGVRIETMDSEISNFIKKFSKKIKKHVSIHNKSYSKSSSYQFCSRDLYDFARTFISPKKEGKKKSENLHLPNPIIKNNGRLAYLLRGMFDTDGWVGNHQILYCTKSESLSEELQYALLRFGIISFRKAEWKKYKNERRLYWILYISDQQSIKKFVKEISFSIRRKKQKITHMINSFKDERTREDNLPISPKKIQDYMRENSIKHKGSRWAIECQHAYTKPVSRAIIKKLLEKDQSTSQMAIYLGLLASSDVLWDKIVKIEEKPKEILYDFEVPETRNFIGNAFVLHNSGRIVFSVLRMPKYADELIDETDYIFTPRMRAESAKLIEGFVPQLGINYAIEELEMRQTMGGRRDANQWMFLEKGQQYLKFYPIPPLLEP